MPVTAPPRSTDTQDDRDLAQRVADLEALIKEARRRARRRRQFYAAALLAGAGAVAGALFGIGGRGHGSVGDQVASGPPAAAAAARGPGAWGASLGPDGGAFTLAVDPSNPAIVYAAGFGDVFKSVNGGRSWKKGPAEPWRRVSALTVDATRPRVVYAGTDRGIAKTLDGGRHWRLLNRGLFDGETKYERGHRLGEGFVASLVVDPRDRQTVYAITDRGLFRTTSGGERWSIIGPALYRKRTCLHCNGRYYGYIVAAAIDPRNGTIYANWATGSSAFPLRVYTSTDRGSSWRHVQVRGSLQEAAFTALAVDRAGTLYATVARQLPYFKQLPGVIKSTDGGRNWSAAGLPKRTVWELQVDRGNGTTLYAAATEGFFESHDGGATWRSLGNIANAPTAVVSDPHDPNVRFGIRDGVVKSLDGGRTWAAANNGLIASGIYSLVFAPGSATTLYAADAKSVDGGRTWHRDRAGLGKSRIEALAPDPHLPGTLYAGTAGQGLFKSTDAGVRWSAIPAPSQLRYVAGLAVDPELAATVYAVGCGPGCGGFGNHLFKTADGGKTWRELTLPDWGSNRGIQVLAIDPKDPNELFAGTSYWFSKPGLYRSSDGGSTWQAALTAPEHRSFSASAVVFDPRDPDNIYVSSRTDGVLKSSDGGKTWAEADTGLSGKAIVALAIDPAHPRTLYASTGGVWTTMPARVFRSTDGARTWHSISDGLPAVGVEVFAIDASGRTVFAGTGGDGVIRLRTRG